MRLRSSLPIALVLASLLSATAFADTFPSKVKRVVFHPEMAEVTREVEMDHPADSVILVDTSPLIAADSVTARILEGDSAITGASIDDVFLPNPPDERLRELEKQIEDLQQARRKGEEAARNAKREKELLDSGVLALFDNGRGDGKGAKEHEPVARLSQEEILSTLSLYRAQSEKIDERVLSLEKEQRETDRKIDALRREAEEIRNPKPLQQKVVRIHLSKPCACRVEVSYRQPAAGYTPTYNARLLPAAGKVEIGLFAEAWQRSGQEWKDVTFAFSSGRPARMAQLPPLPSWEPDFRPPFVYKDRRALEALAAPSRMMSKSGAPAPEEEEAEEPAPVVVRNFASLEVELPQSATLSGRGQKKTFLLSNRSVPVKVTWRSIPRVTEGAFVNAEGKNETGLPILPAPASLFLDSAFAGKGALSQVAEGENFRIDFGRDDAVPVSRKEIRRVGEEGGVLTKVRRVSFRYEITAQNFRKSEVPLTVLDRIPVPRQKEIVLKDLEVSDGGKVGQKEAGEVQWDLALKPGEKKVLSLSFTVEYPADKEIVGL
jgi:uncharacterized protein (TIGR02231 family)